LRTIFVGNLSSEVAQKRVSRQILLIIDGMDTDYNDSLCKNSSISIFYLPYRLQKSNPLDSALSHFKNPQLNFLTMTGKKAPRPHDRDRTSSWRKHNPATDEPKNDEKKFLTPSQKKKVAFINHELHPSADSVNAYIVFAHPPPAKERPSNLPPPPPVMDPFEAARLAVEKCNGTVFMDRTIRVDSLGRPADDNGKQSALSAAFGGDPKSTVFVGSLDFASKEEDVRAFFESLLTAERGAPSQASEATKNWVSRVRIVRDKDTQLGRALHMFNLRLVFDYSL